MRQAWLSGLLGSHASHYLPTMAVDVVLGPKYSGAWLRQEGILPEPISKEFCTPMQTSLDIRFVQSRMQADTTIVTVFAIEYLGT